MFASQKKIFLITRTSVQNLLFLDWLSKEIGSPVIILDIKKPVMFYASEGALFLYDIESATRKANLIWPRLISESCNDMRAILINCPKALSLYESSLWTTVKTVLHENCPPEKLIENIKFLIESLDNRDISPYKNINETEVQENSDTTNLTERECEILHELCKGESNMQIAKTFFISENTVRTHLYNIFKKISVNNRIQAVNWANNRFRAQSLQS